MLIYNNVIYECNPTPNYPLKVSMATEIKCRGARYICYDIKQTKMISLVGNCEIISQCKRYMCKNTMTIFEINIATTKGTKMSTFIHMSILLKIFKIC